MSVKTSSLPAAGKEQYLRVRLFLEQAPASFYIFFFTVLYFPLTVWLSSHKLFWDDEFFTLYLSRISTWKALLQALSTGADQHPPSYYWLEHLCTQVFGASHLGLRLPSMVGFWVLCVALFFLIRPMTGPIWACVGMLFPTTTKLYYYSVEARGYGLVSGFTAVAVLCWFQASESRRRKLTVPLMALSLAGAVASHYYAAIVILCLAVGEVTRTWYRRKVDLPVWAALSFAFLPILAFLPVIRSARGYSTHFWAVPHWGDAFSFYRIEFSAMVALYGIAGLILFIDLNFRRSRTRSLEMSGRPLNRWHAIAILCLTGVPVLVMVMAKFVTHGYSDRYAIASVVGVSVLFTHLTFRLESHPNVAAVLIFACLVLFLYQVEDWKWGFDDSRRLLNEAYANVKPLTQQQDVVMLDITLFHQLSYYAPREVASRLVFMADPESSIKFLGHDTIDRGLLELSPWFPLRVLSVTNYTSQHTSLLAYGGVHSWSWFTFDMPRYGITDFVKRTGDSYLLFSMHNVHPAHAPTSFDLRFPEDKMLVHFEPTTGPSLCTRSSTPWMCPILNDRIPEANALPH